MVFLLRLLPLALCLFIPTVSAYAAGEAPLIYRDIPADLRIREIAGFLEKSGVLMPGARTEVALIDLNVDGINEAVFRQIDPACEETSDCLHILAGVSNKQPVLLGTFRARKIGISGENSYGVKKVLVYNQKQNDFRYITYGWNAFTSSFDPE